MPRGDKTLGLTGEESGAEVNKHIRSIQLLRVARPLTTLPPGVLLHSNPKLRLVPWREVLACEIFWVEFLLYPAGFFGSVWRVVSRFYLALSSTTYRPPAEPFSAIRVLTTITDFLTKPNFSAAPPSVLPATT